MLPVSSTRSTVPVLLTALRKDGRFLRRLFVVAAVLLVAGDAIFWFMYAGVAAHFGLAQLDVPVHDVLVHARTPVATTLLVALSAVTSPAWTVAAGAATAVAWVAWKKEFWRPGLLLGSMALAAGLSEFIKHAVGRTRPSASDFLLGPDASFSFPSGHTLGTGVFLLVLAYLVTSRRVGTRDGRRADRRIVAWAAAAGTTAAVAFSRLYLGYHWLTDVVASIGLASAVVGVVMLADGIRGSLSRV